MITAVYDNPINGMREYWEDRRKIKVIAEVALAFAHSDCAKESLKNHGVFEYSQIHGDSVAIKGFEVCLSCDSLAHLVLFSEEVPDLDNIPVPCVRCLTCESIYATKEIQEINNNISDWYFTEDICGIWDAEDDGDEFQ